MLLLRKHVFLREHVICTRDERSSIGEVLWSLYKRGCVESVWKWIPTLRLQACISMTCASMGVFVWWICRSGCQLWYAMCRSRGQAACLWDIREKRKKSWKILLKYPIKQARLWGWFVHPRNGARFVSSQWGKGVTHSEVEWSQKILGLVPFSFSIFPHLLPYRNRCEMGMCMFICFHRNVSIGMGHMSALFHIHLILFFIFLFLLLKSWRHLLCSFPTLWEGCKIKKNSNERMSSRTSSLLNWME